LNAPLCTFRDIDTRYATSTGLTRITPVHQLSEDLAWSHGAHNLTFGGVVRLINNHRLDYGHSFSNIETNGSVLITGVVSSSRPMLKHQSIQASVHRSAGPDDAGHRSI